MPTLHEVVFVNDVFDGPQYVLSRYWDAMHRWPQIY